jgi:hypothetical protein
VYADCNRPTCKQQLAVVHYYFFRIIILDGKIYILGQVEYSVYDLTFPSPIASMVADSNNIMY